MLKKTINEYMVNNFSLAVQSSYEDVLMHPESETREEEIQMLVDQVYKAGFREGMQFLEWLIQY